MGKEFIHFTTKKKKVNQRKNKTVMQEIRDKKAIRNGIQKTKSKMTKIPHQ